MSTVTGIPTSERTSATTLVPSESKYRYDPNMVSSYAGENYQAEDDGNDNDNDNGKDDSDSDNNTHAQHIARTMTTMHPHRHEPQHLEEPDVPFAHHHHHEGDDSIHHHLVQQQQQRLIHKSNIDDEWLIVCRCESARAVATLLSCLKDVSGGTTTTTTTATNEFFHVHSNVSRSNRRRRGRPKGGGDGDGIGDGIGDGDRNGLGEGSMIQTTAFSSSLSGPRAITASSSSLQPVTVFCTPAGLTFHCFGKSKQMQASVEIPAGLFSEYRLRHPEAAGGGNHPHPTDGDSWQAGGEFSVNLTTLLECLYVLGTNHLDQTRLCMSYNAITEVFKIELLEEDTGILSSAAIPGMIVSHGGDSTVLGGRAAPCPGQGDDNDDYDDVAASMGLAFRSSPIAARIIVRSQVLQEIFSELSLVQGAKVATVSLGRDGLAMVATGYSGEALVSVPVKGQHVVSFEQQQQGGLTSANPGNQHKRKKRAAAARNYPMHALVTSMRGLDIATETCITMNQAGMMAIQHQVVDREIGDLKSPSFVDCILCCLVDDGLDEEDENNDASESDVNLGNRGWAVQSGDRSPPQHHTGPMPLSSSQAMPWSQTQTSNTAYNEQQQVHQRDETRHPTIPGSMLSGTTPSFVEQQQPTSRTMYSKNDLGLHVKNGMEDDDSHTTAGGLGNITATSAKVDAQAVSADLEGRLFGRATRTSAAVTSGPPSASSQDESMASSTTTMESSPSPPQRSAHHSETRRSMSSFSSRATTKKGTRPPPTRVVQHQQHHPLARSFVHSSSGRRTQQRNARQQPSPQPEPMHEPPPKRQRPLPDENRFNQRDGEGHDTGEGDEDFGVSENMLPQPTHPRTYHPEYDDDDEEEELSQALDVTARASPKYDPRRDRDGECSSPELVYGQQH